MVRLSGWNAKIKKEMFAEYLQLYREILEMSYDQIAPHIEAISGPQVCRWERCISSPDNQKRLRIIKKLEKLAKKGK